MRKSYIVEGRGFRSWRKAVSYAVALALSRGAGVDIERERAGRREALCRVDLQRGHAALAAAMDLARRVESGESSLDGVWLGGGPDRN